jgi:hypothetical protein
MFDKPGVIQQPQIGRAKLRPAENFPSRRGQQNHRVRAAAFDAQIGGGFGMAGMAHKFLFSFCGAKSWRARRAFAMLFCRARRIFGQ